MLHKRVGQGEIFINIYESEGRKKGGRGEGERENKYIVTERWCWSWLSVEVVM